MITQAQIKELYDAYVAATGLDLRLTTALNYQLERFAFEGYTCDDIRLVVGYIKRRIRIGRREKESLLPRNLIENTSHFAEDMSMAKAEIRERSSKGDTARHTVLAQSGRTTMKQPTCKQAAQIMQEHEKMAEMLKQFRTEGL
jgi:hypothetical protein